MWRGLGLSVFARERENERGAKKDGPRRMETEMMMRVVDSQVQYT
jgi:hypothetical protein